MKATIVIAGLAAAFTSGNGNAAERTGASPSPAPWVTRYAANEGFYHVLADKRFVGTFVTKKGACSVDLLVGRADEDDARGEPMRLTFDVRASQAVAVQAGDRQSLDIACAADANGLAIHAMRDNAAPSPTN